MKPLLLTAIVAVVVFAQTKSTAPPVKAAPPKATKGNLLDPGTLKAQAPASFRSKFATTKGDIIVEVTRDWAPRGADRFYNLVRSGFFTDAAFFRVVPGFVVQFGISPRPDIARAWQNARIFDDPVKHANKKGTLVFATAGPNTRTTQLFINLADNVGLDPQGFSPFGEVVDGMNVVQALNAEYREQPQQPLIESQGKAYLDKSFPRLDRILTATIVPTPVTATPAAPAAKQ